MYKQIIAEVPDDLIVEEDDDGLVVTVPICLSDDGGTAVSVECHACPQHYEGRYFHEFRFEIVVTPLEDEEAEIVRLQNSVTAKQCFPATCKPLILDIVVESYRILAYAIDSGWIYRVTYLPDPPDIALIKHQIITNSLHDMGYILDESGTDEMGREFWFHRRI
jgi:hypothetical protein